MTTQRLQRCTIAITLAVLIPRSLADETAARKFKLFYPVPTLARSLSLKDTAVAAEQVAVDLEGLAAVQPTEAIDLNVSFTQHLNGRVQSVTRRKPMRFTVKGSLDQVDRGTFIIVVHEDAAMGILRLRDTGEIYSIRFLSGNLHLVERVDPLLAPPEHCFFKSTVPPPDLQRDEPTKFVAPFEAPKAVSSTAGACAQPVPTYDLLMPYTHLARQAMGGTNAAIAQCQLAVEAGNEAYANSQINIHLRLVHTMEVNYDEPGEQDAWLGWLASQMLLGAAGEARETYGADFVCMLSAGGTGYGYCTTNEAHALSTAKWSNAVDFWTLVHEMGHNQGCNHNREDRGTGCGTGHEHGYHFYGDSGQHWGTVMSYPGVRIPNFSNPNIDHDGQPTGIPIGQTGESYTAYVHNQVASAAQNFRPTHYEFWVDFDETYWNQTGTWTLPYDTLQEGLDSIVYGVGASEPPTIWLFAPSSSDFTGTINQDVILRTCGDDVFIGLVP